MIGSMAMAAWLSQYPRACCLGASSRKLSASSWMKAVGPARSIKVRSCCARAHDAPSRTAANPVLCAMASRCLLQGMLFEEFHDPLGRSVGIFVPARMNPGHHRRSGRGIVQRASAAARFALAGRAVDFARHLDGFLLIVEEDLTVATARDVQP